MRNASNPTPIWLAALAIAILASGCVGRTVNTIPPGAGIPAGQEARLEAATGIKLLEFDGQPVEATKLIITPGKHRIGFRARRSLRQVDEALNGVYHVGECTLDLEAVPAGRYRIMLVKEMEVGSWRGNPHAGVGSTMKGFDTRVGIRDLVTGDSELISCEMLLDCRRLKDGVRRSSACAYN